MKIQSKHWAYKIFCILTLFALVTGTFGPAVGPVAAQDGEPPAGETPEVQALIDLGASIQYDDAGNVRSVSFDEPSRTIPRPSAISADASRPEAALGFLASYGAVFGIRDASQNLIVKEETAAAKGGFVHFQQTYQGIPVIGGELIVQLDSANNIRSANGEVASDVSISTTPAIDAATAAQTALGAVAKWQAVDAATLTATDPELWVYDPSLIGPGDGPIQLVWRLEVSSTDLAPIREFVLVNAQQGGIPLHFNQVDNFGAPAQLPDETPTDVPSETPTEIVDPTQTATSTEAATEAPTETASATETAQPTETATPEPTLEITPTPEPTEDNAPIVVALGATWYVAPTGSNSNACSSAAMPCLTINGAIGKATNGDIILVAVGTYTGTGSEVVLLNKDITLLGGWDSTFTTQDGFSVIDGAKNRRGINNTATSVVERFIVQRGSASGGANIRNVGTIRLNYVRLTQGAGSSTGGGLYNQGTAIINNSTIDGNSGSGIYNNNVNNNNPTVTLNNSTVTGNSNSSGGGILSKGVGNINLYNTTVTNNTASSYGGGVAGDVVSFRPTITLSNSILAGNTSTSGANCYYMTFVSSGYNLIGTTTSACTITAAAGDQLNAVPALGSLLGTLGYHYLYASSTAINAGNPAGCTGSEGALSTDQRGVTRDGQCDIGAFEYTTPGDAASFTALAGSNQRSAPLFPFENRLKVLVLDSVGSPIPDLTVQFSAPDSGASAVFADTDTPVSSAQTDQDGITLSPQFIANESFGDYMISLTANSLTQSVFPVGNVGWYVAVDGSNSNDCQSPASACATLNGIMAKPNVLAGDTVMVGAGTYTGAGTEVVLAQKSLRFLGGWVNGFTERTGNSIIDGQLARKVLMVDPGVTTVFDTFTFTKGYSEFGGTYVRGSLVLRNSAVTGNKGQPLQGYGGSGFNIFGVSLILENTTVSGNSGGAAIEVTAGSVLIYNSTITANTSSGLSRFSGTITLANSIVAGNTSDEGKPDCDGAVGSAGYNIIGNTTGCTFTAATGDILNTNAKLGTFLGSPGYHYLYADSPAINAANPSGCYGYNGVLLETDQRGVNRVDRCDMGAFEYSPSGSATSIAPLIGSGQSADPLTTYPVQLKALVLDSNSVPVVGVPVVFEVPASGASGTFAGSEELSITVLTDAGGVATAPVFTANNLTGNYYVLAATDGVAEPAQFALSNGGFWYVAVTGSDTNDCLFVVSPCATINGALAKATSGDVVRVAQGTYTGSGSEVVLINKSISLSGGWDASFESQSTQSAINGQSQRRGVTVAAGVVVDLDRFDLLGGSVNGGGIYNSGTLTLTNSIVRDNLSGSAASSGGIYNNINATLTIIATTIKGNSHAGINSDNDSNLTIINSTLNGNLGRGIKTYSNTVIISNTTISGNTEGGIYLNQANVTINNSTITANLTYGGISEVDGTVTLSNSILAGNRSFYYVDCNGDVLSGGYNLIGSTSGCRYVPSTGDITNSGYRLDVLQDNGGPTWTHGLLTGSPAINAANPAVPGSSASACLTTDQRAITRPVGSRCDIGAFEGVLASGATPVTQFLTYTSNNGSQLPGISFLCDQSQPACTSGVNPDGDKAHKYALDTYNYYLTNFGRDSLDNHGMVIISSVDYCQSGCPYANAGWNGAQMVYGGGSSTTDSLGYSQADDVVGHELTHGVTDKESDLFYYYQSGAINESLSDIFGEFVDQTNGSGNDTAGVKWKLGEDLSSGILRDMAIPGNYGDPDKMTSANYYEGGDDLGGVHTNSGVNNKAAYLMVEGGTFNSKTVTALGMNKTAHIYYDAMTNLLTSASDYLDLYNALYQACTSLVGQHSITASDCTEVRDATQAVEMQLQPANNFNVEATVCNTGFAVDIYKDDFEAGASNWTFGKLNGDTTTRWQYDSPWGTYAHSGVHHLFADDTPPAASDSYAAMTPAVTLPANAYLYFHHAYGFEDTSGPTKYWDGGVLEYTQNGGATWIDAGSLIESPNNYRGTLTTDADNPIEGRQAFVGDSHGYIASRVNLSSLAGKSVQFRWRMGLDSSYVDWGWWLDDVRIYKCITKSDVLSDYDGDGKSDIAKYLDGNGAVWWKKSSNNAWDGFYLGADTVQYVRASDFDGDGKADPAKFMPNPGVVWWWKSTTQSWDGLYLGSDTYTFIPGSDFDGDGKADPAKFYPNTGVVWWWKSTTQSWGGLYLGPGSYEYVTGSDFNGDGKTDPAKFENSTGTLWWWRASNSTWQGVYLGNDSFKYLTAADYDGDGKTDPAKYYATDGLVWFYKSSTSTWDAISLGTGTFTHVSGADFDGDGKTDLAKFFTDTKTLTWRDSSTGLWQTVSPGPDTYTLVTGFN